jgi:hypothetical protein
MNQSISSQLYEPVPTNDPVLKILLTVNISSNGNYAFSKYSNEKGDFFGVNPKSHITIRYTPKDIPWDKHHQIIITQRNIFQLRLGLKKFYRIFQRDDLYRYDNLGKITEVVTDNSDRVIISFGLGQMLRLAPTIIRDRQNMIYPGVNLTINREENQVDLTIEEFEGIYDLFEHIDLYQAGLTLLQSYIGMRKTPVEQTMQDLEERKPPKTNTNYIAKGKSLFDGDRKEYVKTPPKWEQPTSLDDL